MPLHSSSKKVFGFTATTPSKHLPHGPHVLWWSNHNRVVADFRDSLQLQLAEKVKEILEKLLVESLCVLGEKYVIGKTQVPQLDFLRSLKTNWQMTDGVYGTGIQYLDSSSDMRDKFENSLTIKSTGQLTRWLGRISDNIVYLEHFEEEDKYSQIIEGETIQIGCRNFLERNEALDCCMNFGICLLKIVLSI
jgi:hypothetical protein